MSGKRRDPVNPVSYTHLDVYKRQILKDADGAIIGLSGTKADGSKVTVNAKNVIIATGGYASNREMTSRYAASIGDKYATGVPAGNLGDGLKLGEQVNAKIFDAPEIQTCLLYTSRTSPQPY